MSIRVAILDDHPLIIAGVTLTLEKLPICKIRITACTISDLFVQLEETPCDVAVLDYAMPMEILPDGVQLIKTLRLQYPKMQIIMLTTIDHPMVINNLVTQDIAGLLSKADPLEHLCTAFSSLRLRERYYSPTIKRILSLQNPRVHIGLHLLSPKELEVLRLLVGGLSVSQVATKLSRSKQTISTHKISAMNKLNISSNAELFEAAYRYNFNAQKS
ncbi:two-component system capsular synthesis response regulator RcsB [Herbaspirillum sp. Sphag1AN]|uniref:response regulator transcription factor n=1 Tax=unclassified Herbaspirillum TaxID=2624150 RepID=UPI001613B920|nr:MULTISPECIES: response regulator transcription factor [unclassified Herbaspirillum]MBB3213390.1 two-component system capsular synthesis response regulator RcsB [Herbaspirillum sp. Sphag1AN]MBB3246566.1 two-component system capsular synthesis response regulator RcsB [Herbaspirillum sp. Sphag64]